MKQDMLNFSADLRRMAYWAHDGRYELVKKMSQIARKKYKLPRRMACYDNVWEVLDKLEMKEEHCSERALTASIIIKNLAQN